MTPEQLQTYLNNLVEKRIYISTMIWGPPGIGKSSIVHQIVARHNMQFIDLRLSQLAPTDIRGLPVALPDSKSKIKGTAVWYPPEFLPREGEGVLLLDEMNMAPPAVQGIAQQLILDRKVGSYIVPQGWFIWAAGNRKEDRASVFDMPAPLANRFLHLEVEPDLNSFKSYAFRTQLAEEIVAFLSFRPALLHKLDPQKVAWASPRSWEMASKLYKAGLEIAPAVGEAAAAEFEAFVKIYSSLPDIEGILAGKGEGLAFPKEPSMRYALVVGLAYRVQTAEQAQMAMVWLKQRAQAEWVQLYSFDMLKQMRERGKTGVVARLFKETPEIQQFMAEYRELIGIG